MIIAFWIFTRVCDEIEKFPKFRYDKYCVLYRALEQRQRFTLTIANSKESNINFHPLR